MPVSPVAQYQNIQSQALKSFGRDNSSLFADTLLKQQTFLNKKSAPLVIASSINEVEPGGGKHIEAGKMSSPTLLTSSVIHSYQDLEKESGLIDNSNNNNLFAKKASRPVRIQNYLKGMLKDKNSNIMLGTLSKASPTVSHVVRNNENIMGYHWDIIHAEINKSKPYSTATQGTTVSINPNTLELIFDKPNKLKENSIEISEKIQTDSAPQNLSRIELLKEKLQSLAQEDNRPFVLGTLSKETTTVSQVLNNNEHTKDLYLQITFSETNKNKPYNSLQPGTKICIDPVTLELIFEAPLTDNVRKGAAAEACLDKPCTGLSKNERLHQYVASLEPDSNKLIKIGTLGKNQPSISQVLNNDQRFAGYHWGIILADINSDKPFNRLGQGTEVSINPETLELLFNVSSSAEKNTQIAGTTEVITPAKQTLAESLKIEKQILKDVPSLPARSASDENNKINFDQVPVVSVSEPRVEARKGAALIDTQHSVTASPKSGIHQYVASLEPDSNKLIKIGTLNKDMPTISQLLKDDKRFDGLHWDIILADINSDKPFKTLSSGTQVSINPENLELLFNVSDSAEKITQAPLSNEVTTPIKSAMAESLKIEKHVLKDLAPLPSRPEPVIEKTGVNLGQIPVSLTTELAKEVKEIAALKSSQPAAVYQQAKKEDAPVLFNDKLVSSARQMIGRSSAEVDNYDLLVNGLEAQGISYEGKGGLKENLGHLASLSWLDESDFQNVEGILRIGGETLYIKNMAKEATPEQLTDLTDKMGHYMEKGQIVTMSTSTMKQSGIVSSREGNWTLINSNSMANENSSVTGRTMRVDEVSLIQ